MMVCHSTCILPFHSILLIPFPYFRSLSLCASFRGEPSISPPLSVCPSAAVWQWDHSISPGFSFHRKLIGASHLVPTHGLWLAGHLASQVCFCTATPSVHLYNYIYTVSVSKQWVKLVCHLSLLHTTDISLSPFAICQKGCNSLSHAVLNIVLL